MNFMILFILSHSFQSKNLHLYPKDLSQVKGDINSLILQDIQFSTFDLPYKLEISISQVYL